MIVADAKLGHAVHFVYGKVHGGKLAAGHQSRRHLGQRNAGGLAHVGNRARGARIDFQHVNRVALNGVLHVHQADDAESAGQAIGVVANVGQRGGRERNGRQNTGGVAGVDAGLFDVFHDAADDHIFAVGERIDVDFGGFLEELVDQNGPRRAHQRGPRDIFLHRVEIVGDDHGAATQHVTGAHQDGQSDLARRRARPLRERARCRCAAGECEGRRASVRSGGGPPPDRWTQGECR